MKQYESLVGRRFDSLRVIEQAPSTARRRAWVCECECGQTVIRTTDSLTRKRRHSCLSCARKQNAIKAREAAGFVDGTSICRINKTAPTSGSSSGVRGVYYERRINRWRARLRFKGKIMSFGSYARLEDAIAARKKAEEEYFGSFLEAHAKNSTTPEPSTPRP